MGDLIRLASFAGGTVKSTPQVDIRGLIASPSFPPQLRAKGTTRADQSDDGWDHDTESDMLICRIGSDEDVRLDELFF